MTQNAYYYAQLGETREHNRRTEEETYRANKAKEDFNLMQLNESIRHSQALEALQQQEIDESRRAARARELETVRADIAREQENIRAHQASEAISRMANQQSYAVNRMRLAETERADKASEALQGRRQNQDLIIAGWNKSLQEGKLNLEEKLGSWTNRIKEGELATRRGELGVKEQLAANDTELLQYQKMESLSRTFKNVTGGVRDFTSSVGDLVDTFSKAASLSGGTEGANSAQKGPNLESWVEQWVDPKSGRLVTKTHENKYSDN